MVVLKDQVGFTQTHLPLAQAKSNNTTNEVIKENNEIQ